MMAKWNALILAQAKHLLSFYFFVLVGLQRELGTSIIKINWIFFWARTTRTFECKKHTNCVAFYLKILFFSCYCNRTNSVCAFSIDFLFFSLSTMFFLLSLLSPLKCTLLAVLFGAFQIHSSNDLWIVTTKRVKIKWKSK